MKTKTTRRVAILLACTWLGVAAARQDLADPSGLGERFVAEIKSVVNGGNADYDLVFMLMETIPPRTSMRMPTQEDLKGAFNGVSITDIQNGTIPFNGRSLPAAVVTVEIGTIDRRAGEYGKVCLKYGAAMDKEFNMIRSYFYAPCKDSDERINAWKEINKFSL